MRFPTSARGREGSGGPCATRNRSGGSARRFLSAVRVRRADCRSSASPRVEKTEYGLGTPHALTLWRPRSQPWRAVTRSELAAPAWTSERGSKHETGAGEQASLGEHQSRVSTGLQFFDTLTAPLTAVFRPRGWSICRRKRFEAFGALDSGRAK